MARYQANFIDGSWMQFTTNASPESAFEMLTGQKPTFVSFKKIKTVLDCENPTHAIDWWYAYNKGSFPLVISINELENCIQFSNVIGISTIAIFKIKAKNKKMLCKNYRNLTPAQKVQFIGELTHAAMFNDNIFNMAQVLIDAAKEKGILEKVVIRPELENVLQTKDELTEIHRTTLNHQ